VPSSRRSAATEKGDGPYFENEIGTVPFFTPQTETRTSPSRTLTL